MLLAHFHTNRGTVTAELFFNHTPMTVGNFVGLAQGTLANHAVKKGVPFYNEDDLSDMPTKFFVAELIREKIYHLYGDEIPYHSAVLINEFKEKENIIKIQADIIVHRETQKAIIIGERGTMIREIGIQARQDIEAFVGQKVFLELFVKVRPKWRDNDQQLKEYGYQ